MEVEAFILWGFKFNLNKVFEKGWLNPNIMEEDDWQLLNMKEDIDRIKDLYILNDSLKTALDEGWSLYILTSSQEECDPEKSYLFFYMARVEMKISGDYGTGTIDSLRDCKVNCKVNFKSVLDMEMDPNDWTYHWVMKYSW